MNQTELAIFEWLFPQANVPTTKVVQFTDIHMDLHYKDGGNSDCGSGIPICCRESDGLPANEDVKAGKYGHWMCALPMETTEEMFKNARDQHSVLLIRHYTN